MPPEPNNSVNKMEESTMDTNEDNIVYLNNTNSDDSSDDNIETEYAGYKLLQQQEVDSSCDDDNVIFQESEDQLTLSSVDPDNCTNIYKDFNIDYENLHCHVMEDNFQAKELGFPELKDEIEDISKHSATEDFHLTDNQVELVKSVMAGFKLPEINVPVWAKEMSDGQWKVSVEKTMEKLKNK